METPLYSYYLNQLGNNDRPEFMEKYLETPCLKRLKKVAYFCGMNRASKNVYHFKEYITRYDHSLSVALLTWKLTHDKKTTIAGLFHDIGTPCFSHVIDYMNKDYANQESTEEYTEKIMRNDEYLLKYLKEDDIAVEDIIHFKQYSIVDNHRPRVCADRLDGVILTGISWTKDVEYHDIKNIIEDVTIFLNEDGELEIGFSTLSVAKRVLDISNRIDLYCHSNEDNYMMELLADITRKAITSRIVTYHELYTLNEDELFKRLKNSDNPEILDSLVKFETITMDQIPQTVVLNVKVRDLNPLVGGIRIKQSEKE
ncbi:MAG: HD domain-containing protein [Clostridia bacterium]|nr:HD domain-containing protein [Clostridia bacterium]